jgi:hypothetical protein
VSDQRHDSIDEAARLLRAPIAVDPAVRARVMDAVRAVAAPGVPAKPASSVTALRVLPRRSARGSALTTLAVAAGLAGIITLGIGNPRVMSTLPVHGVGMLGDTVAATLRDTVRLVQFMLVAPTASRVALAGEFNGWNTRVTPMSRPSGESAWTVAVSLPPGRHSYAFVVNDTQWVSGSMRVDK